MDCSSGVNTYAKKQSRFCVDHYGLSSHGSTDIFLYSQVTVVGTKVTEKALIFCGKCQKNGQHMTLVSPHQSIVFGVGSRQSILENHKEPHPLRSVLFEWSA